VSAAIDRACDGWYDSVVQGCHWGAMARAALDEIEDKVRLYIDLPSVVQNRVRR
jgi:hypothetical protein